MGAAAGRNQFGEYVRAAGVIAGATGVCLVLRAHLATIDVAMVLLVGVVVAAARYERGPALLASLLSIVAFDFLFVPPYYTFNVRDTQYYLTFGVMLVVALTMSQLTARIRAQREAAAEREQRTAALYTMDRELASAPDTARLLAIAARHLGQAVGGEALLLRADKLDQQAGEPVWPEGGVFDSASVRIAATWSIAHGEAAGWGTAHGSEAEAMLAPLLGSIGPVGLAVIQPPLPDRVLLESQRETVLGLVEVAARALERRLLAEREAHARAEVEAERLRTALLSSLSHDLRTPLASIEGAASSLLEESTTLPAEIRRELLESILDESRRMTRLVTNLLNMIRVQTGTLAVQKSWQPLEEALGVALIRLDEQLGAHPVTTRLPSDLPLVPIDELLIEQVLINLLENAVRYTPAGTAIEISARAEPGAVLVEVADHGPGVPAGEEESVFGRFYRAASAQSADAGAGAGLGLTICRGIVTAHGGRIWLAARAGGGTVVRFTLPLVGPPVEAIPAEPAAR